MAAALSALGNCDRTENRTFSTKSTLTGHRRRRRTLQSGEAAARDEREDGQSQAHGRCRHRLQASYFARSQSRITDCPLGNRGRTCRREHGGADAKAGFDASGPAVSLTARTRGRAILLAIVFALLDALRRVLLRPYDPQVCGSSRGFQRSLSMRGRPSQLRRPASLAKGVGGGGQRRFRRPARWCFGGRGFRRTTGLGRGI
jgi:hypothetical protein